MERVISKDDSKGATLNQKPLTLAQDGYNPTTVRLSTSTVAKLKFEFLQNFQVLTSFQVITIRNQQKKF